ncbi:MAG: 30S ribosomal protein S9 [Candidatus Edwardsbacteria bacterium RIFOXYD12_FULL_50_11]|jgi:small subunit ribosomal protein S9|uniref:Small ribosomal subunit protein uS9 n=1 Tax=Candidatus Edwardsbacteria bacterium GWF2_54_11 TaxID=1817851 RepID=A0A1F5R9X7_9BACT|nr:30S ribosomal protein S9 [Candidatus Edwardsbacteria bacterium]OGF04803.1 MAG: 30S ribosomal protein S9 [Candidatus Edwardsbacteria bacterium RifOxyC12_full_54_24]OGF06619.1 MAG: 30S ribosomal protein S9 [Candidatus Edwardsbacteria bacterium RifOxyA12_full_54_48]OGF11227.1 MAG: 30S ribosomal protein S9 [Candidatus Edwardsbacteria bacterium GWF2_54_11]OGF11678.1 MAG: 30S ribosomal protein S9 [Candidatus Edwardsbacteria bacterium GWE2_54_12]OGF17936.1 MAG: 30S ribosomal protein S9 [Candidatus
MTQNVIRATGRRKSSVAQVKMTPGQGKMTVNNRTCEEYFCRPTLVMMVKQPLELTSQLGKFDIWAKVEGGGVAGQAGALRLGISRALNLVEQELRPPLKSAGLLTRDPREKERKKYGQKKARKRFQFSKR